MSIMLETTTIQVTKEERTRQIVISTPRGADPTLEIYREKVSSSDGEVFGTEQVGVVTRTLSQVADQSFTIGKTTLTGAQLAVIIAGVADQLRQEDKGAALRQ